MIGFVRFRTFIPDNAELIMDLYIYADYLLAFG